MFKYNTVFLKPCNMMLLKQIICNCNCVFTGKSISCDKEETS